MSSSTRIVTPRLLFGLALIVFGILFTLDNLGFRASDVVFEYWPVILIVIGGLKLIDSFGAGLFMIATGCLFLMPVLIDGFRVRQVIPLFLMLIGLRFVLRSLGFGGRHRGRRTAEPTGRMRALALLSGVKRQVDSPAFEGGDLTAFLGGCEVDLSKARLADGRAEIDVMAMWGGIEITVPEDWDVNLDVMPIMGGAEDKTRSSRSGARKDGDGDRARPHLIIKGFALMGGVEVHH